MKKSFSLTVLICGLIVGTADITGACISAYIQYGSAPEKVLKYVASGVYGKEAFAGGTGMALTGLLFHYMIAYTFTWFFFLLYPNFKWMKFSRILTGIAYGIFIWLVMTQLVLPRTQVNPSQFIVKKAIIAVLILIVAIGIPLACMAHYYYSPKNINKDS